MSFLDEFVMYSREAEQSVIGGIMLAGLGEKTREVFAMLKSESFYVHQHKVIFAELKSMNSRNEALDALTLFDNLERKGLSEKSGGFAYLAEIAKNTPSAANIVNYAAMVRDRAIERYSVDRLTTAIEMIRTRDGTSTQEKLTTMSSIFTELATHARSGERRGLREFGSIFEDWSIELERRFGGDGSARGMTSGIKALDDMLSPKLIVKGSLFVIGARPKQGKTTLYTQMALNCACVEKKPALMFSLEMPEDQMFEKIISQKSGVSSNVFYPSSNGEDYIGDFDRDFAKATGVASRLSEDGNLYIDDTPGISVHAIIAESRRIHRERGEIGMILVDYLTLIKADKAERNDLAYGMVTKALKNLAKELRCVVVMLTQLNRDLEKRQDKRPVPSDSRDTGQIEQEADYWVGIYREGSYVDSVDPSETELLLRLNRHGSTGVAHCKQIGGAILEVDQIEAEMKKRNRETKNSGRNDF